MSPQRAALTTIVLIGGGLLRPANAVCAAEWEPKPVVYLVGGIGRMILLSPSARFAFPLAGVDYELRDYHWQHENGGQLRDLQDEPHLLRKSADLANEIRELREREPNRRVYLIGHSAGSAVVVHAAELLPPGSIERIILLSPALSPTYDLTKALRATKRQIVAFNSRYDPALHCTSLFGTADRVYCTSAGVKGFTQPAYLDDAAKHSYERLVQIPWTFQRLLELQRPWHNSPTMPLYLGRQVAPWLKDSPPSEKKPE
jgi:pimeloyl-ACP methyl ester carboxylesterase